ncbi:MAG: gliding motility-associated C-terminal domain-containing protein [Saprospiraceae bacterium]
MYKLIQKLVLFILLFSFANNMLATHNRAGEITYRQTGLLTIEATITTYTKTSSTAADRDTLDICWGDGICERVVRSNGNGMELENDIKVNFYVATHAYPSLGRFVISMNDPNRNGGIKNVNPPTSDSVPFHLETTVTLLNVGLVGPNNSPILLQPPIDVGCVGEVFVHNPNAYDIDGDSLSFAMTVPLQDINTPAINYSLPNKFPEASDNVHVLDATSGVFTWTSPQQAGEYNIAFYIISHRNGVAIDTMIRDMQILILDCAENDPPVIESIEEICIIAGETLEFDVVATAPIAESDQRVTLTALGGPFELENSPATFNDAPNFQNQPLTRTFRWETKCEHIADQYYQVVFRATDDFPLIVQNSSSIDTSYLSTLKTVRIKVVGPPPLDVQAVPGSGLVDISWESPYACEDAENYFQGFTVWRRLGSNLFPLDTCETGLEGKGYTKLTNVPIQDIVNGRYDYLDEDVERGRTYCYRILADFARQTTNTTPTAFFNQVESLPSEEICVQLSRDIPLITNVDILSTGPEDSIRIIWTKPVADDLDTIVNPGPYTYELFRATGFTDGVFEPMGVSFTSLWFAEANDTMFVDEGLDTEGTPYSYEIAFYVDDDFANDNEPLGVDNGTSSVRLNIASTDETNNLFWIADVPWDNYLHHVFIYNEVTTIWDSLTTTTEPEYSHTGLINGEEYCYKVQTVGSYGIEGISDSLLNFSQEECGIPLDTIPPCPPILSVRDDCESSSQNETEETFLNRLSWDVCDELDDVVGYNAYYAPTEGAEFVLIGSYDDISITSDEHKPEFGIAGCYVVTAIDDYGNESAFSNVVCIDNCPNYILPNVFTPNGDGDNELFIPFPYRFIERIEMQVFSRWGGLVFETNDPDISWDGTDLSGNTLTEGTYYYTCRVFESRLEGVIEQEEILSGYIHIIR